MPESIQNVIDYLLGMEFHPAATVITLLVLFIGTQRWVVPYINLAKQAVDHAAKAAPENATGLMATKVEMEKAANQNETNVMIGAFVVSVLAQFGLLWPTSSQAQVLCAVMAISQVAVAWVLHFIIDKYGLLDRVGLRIQKKIEGQT